MIFLPAGGRGEDHAIQRIANGVFQKSERSSVPLRAFGRRAPSLATSFDVSPLSDIMYRSIVVGTDGSDTAREAVRQAGELANAVGGNVLLVSAYEPVPESRLQQVRGNVPADVSWMVNPRQEAEGVLDEEAERLKAAGVSDVETYAREGSPADAILDVADEKEADLIVVGNKGMTGTRRFLLGSVPNKVSHHAPCNVMIVRTA